MILWGNQMEKWLFYGAAILFAFLIGWWGLPQVMRQKKREERIVSCLLFCTAFAVGGFHAITGCAVLVVCMMVLMKREKIVIYRSLGSVGILVLCVVAVICPLWAADPGMAVVSSVKYWAVLGVCAALMQLSDEGTERILEVVPLSGAAMTVFCLIAQFVPQFREMIYLDGNFSGLFEYANTYALFLLVGLCVLWSKQKRGVIDPFTSVVLALGIFLSKNRTGYLLLLVILAVTLAGKRSWKALAGGCFTLGCALAASVLLSKGVGLDSEERLAEEIASGSTLLCRLLYWKDSLGLILANPLGLGPLGYVTAKRVVQTGVYDVTFVHNELLQMLLDFGWIPTLILCAAAIRQLVSKNGPWKKKLILAVILAHCMMDFDLQYLTIWMCLLTVLDLREGKRYEFAPRGIGIRAAVCISVFAGLWLGMGDLLYYAGGTDLCLSVTPFHTLALERKLTAVSDPDETDTLADRVLKINSDVSLAHSAKANVAFSKGNVLLMMEEKECAIQMDPYSLDEYLDYFEKLDYVLQLYLQQGDRTSAAYCLQKIQSIPRMLMELEERSSELAWKIEHTPQITLPEEYQTRLEQLELLMAEN